MEQRGFKWQLKLFIDAIFPIAGELEQKRIIGFLFEKEPHLFIILLAHLILMDL
jgi:hypothetical protein